MGIELSSHIQKHLKSPHIWVVLWLLFLASTIWWHAKGTDQPPIYDAFSYYQKAKYFWKDIRSGQAHNPLNIPPTLRPPGTILMSYPFGIKKDFHGFYFRSAYLPILLLVSAVYLAGYSAKLGHLEQWDLGLLAVFLSTLPVFYHFEIASYDTSGMYWGVVDPYLAGMASLAAATFVRAVKTCSRRWLVFAVLSAAFCLLIKPAGIFVMACIGVSYTVAGTGRFLQTKEVHQRHRIGNSLIFGVLFTAVVDSVAVLCCLHSQYLGPENLAFGKGAISIMRAELSVPWSVFPILLRSQFGIVLPISMVLTGLVLTLYWRRVDPIAIGYGPGSLASLLVAGFLCLVVGVWFWIVWSGAATQARYFVPFALMAVICTVPFFPIMLQKLPWVGRLTFWGLWLTAVGNLAVLLVLKEPPVTWQVAAGVNVSAGRYKTELAYADLFFQHLLEQDKNAYIYSLFANPEAFVIEGALTFKSSLNDYRPRIFIQRPIDWSRPSAIRVGELADSGYILFAPVPEPTRTEILSEKTVIDASDEIRVFDSWLTNLTGSDGIEAVFQTPRARLVKIMDTSKLQASISELLRNREWPKSFLEANPQRWWNQDELAEATQKVPPIVRDLSFGDTFKVHALSLGEEGITINVRAWLEPLRHGSGERWFMFFDQIGANGTITKSDELLLPEQLSKDPRKCLLETITLVVAEPHEVRALAVGIHDDSRATHFLSADKGVRDWDNRRIILPIQLPVNPVGQPHS